MTQKFQDLQANHTWDLVYCPSSVRPIGCKWVYTIKIKSDESLGRYKDCLVVLGYQKEQGIWLYDKTSVLVTKMITIKDNFGNYFCQIRTNLSTRCYKRILSCILYNSKSYICLSASSIPLWSQTSSMSIVWQILDYNSASSKNNFVIAHNF